MKFYTDATYDYRTKACHIGFCNQGLTISDVKRTTASSVNDAELQAARMCIESYPNFVWIFTDSFHVVETLNGEGITNVSHVSRSENIADMLVSAHKESFV